MKKGLILLSTLSAFVALPLASCKQPTSSIGGSHGNSSIGSESGDSNNNNNLGDNTNNDSTENNNGNLGDNSNNGSIDDNNSNVELTSEIDRINKLIDEHNHSMSVKRNQIDISEANQINENNILSYTKINLDLNNFQYKVTNFTYNDLNNNSQKLFLFKIDISSKNNNSILKNHNSYKTNQIEVHFDVVNYEIIIENEIKRINDDQIKLNENELFQNQLDTLNETNILSKTNLNFDDSFNYNAINFEKDEVNKKIKFKISVNLKSNSSFSKESKLFELNYVVLSIDDVLNKEKDRIDNSINSKTIELNNIDTIKSELNKINKNNVLEKTNFIFTKDFEYEIIDFAKNEHENNLSFKIKFKNINDNSKYKISNEIKLKFNLINLTLNIENKDNNKFAWIDGQLLSKLNIKDPSEFNWKYQWEILKNNENKDLDIQNVNNVNLDYFAYDVGDYQIKLSIFDEENTELVNSIFDLKLSEMYYDIMIDNSYVHKVKDGTNLSIVDEKWIKNEIINDENKDAFFFTNIGGKPKNFNNDNIVISNITKHDKYGTLEFDLTLNNSSADGKSDTKRMSFFNFEKSLTNEQILNEFDIECLLTDVQKSELYTSWIASVIKQNKHFSVVNKSETIKTSLSEEQLNKKYGIKSDFSAELDENDSRKIKVNLQLWFIDNSAKKTISKTFDGFKSIIKGIDGEDSPNLTTPNGFISMKQLLNPIYNKGNTSQNDFRQLASKYNWNNVPKEFVYHARFILFQSFENNFDEINYYYKQNDKSINVVAEGIVAKDVDNYEYLVQIIGPSYRPTKINLKKGDRIKVSFDIPYDSSHKFYSIDYSDWSMEKTRNIGLIKEQFGIVLPGYKLNIEQNDKSIYRYNITHLRTFSFVIGKFRTSTNVMYE